MPLSTLQFTSRDAPRKTRGQDGFAVLLSCRALSSPTTCRFIPAHSEWPTIQNGTHLPRSATGLLFEVPEVLLGISVLVQLEVHLCVIGLELRHLLAQEPVQARPIEVTIRVRQVRQHLRDREPLRHRISPSVLLGDLRHQPAQDCRRRLEQLRRGRSSSFIP
jgi:hypothetical protein